jgi:hypothetical protein
LWTILVVVA